MVLLTFDLSLYDALVASKLFFNVLHQLTYSLLLAQLLVVHHLDLVLLTLLGSVDWCCSYRVAALCILELICHWFL